MKKNGFTLIELIGIIVLIALVSLVVFPALVNLTKNSEEKKKNENLNTLYLATENYVTINYDKFSSLNIIGNYEYIKVLTLMNENYIESNMLNPNTNEKFTGDDVVKITKKDDYSYSFELTKLDGI